MPRQRELDRYLLGATLIAAALGVVIVASASGPLAREYYRLPETAFAERQLAAVVAGVLGMLAAAFVPLPQLLRRRYAMPLLAGTWVALAAAFLQAPVAGTHRWLQLPGVSFQPSALAKITLPLALAALLAKAPADERARRRAFRTGLAITGLTVMLVLLEPDLGSAVLLAAAAGAVLFLAGMPWRTVAATAALATAVFAAAVLLKPYRMARISGFVGATSYQVQQSLIALGTGGVVGRGPGKSVQKLFFLPQPHSDFVFAIVGEELGLVGAAAILALLGVIVWRGFRAAWHASSRASALLAAGIATGLAAQALINVSVCLKMMPAKGLPLPLISAGGSDVAVTLVMIGVLLNVSQDVRSAASDYHSRSGWRPGPAPRASLPHADRTAEASCTTPGSGAHA
jgi:cell division protein FtsW